MSVIKILGFIGVQMKFKFDFQESINQKFMLLWIFAPSIL